MDCAIINSLHSVELVLEFVSEESVSEQQLLSGIRPHLNVATICERHILEADGALTLFRIFDRMVVRGDTPTMPTTTVTFTLVVLFRSGEFRTGLDMGVGILAPNEHLPAQEVKIPINFEAPEEKAAVSIGQLQLVAKEPGLYWVIIKLEEEEYTRVPLRLSYQRQPMIQITG